MVSMTRSRLEVSLLRIAFHFTYVMCDVYYRFNSVLFIVCNREMLRLNHQESQMSVKDDSGSIDQGRNIMDNDDTSSDLSDSEHFLTKGAFLLTPASELQMERVGMICEKMSYKGPFSLTKTATGILFKFADLEDYQLTFKKGFHKVTGSRFYKKVSGDRSYFNYARNFRGY